MVKAKNSIMHELAEGSPGVHKLLEIRELFNLNGFNTVLLDPNEAAFTASIKLSDWEVELRVEFCSSPDSHHIDKAQKTQPFELDPIDKALIAYLTKLYDAEPVYWSWNTKVHGRIGAVTVDIATTSDGVIRAYIAEYELGG